MALSGSVSTSTYTTSGGRTYKVVLSWTATQDYAANTSKISWTAKVSASAGYIIISELRITIAGKQAFYRDSTHHTEGYNNTLLASGSMVLSHNDDGSKKFSAKVEAGIYQYAINKSGESEFTLNSIPRASAIGATSAEIESNSTIVVTKKTKSYTHSIKYSFGSLSGYITASGGISSKEEKISETSISFKVPASFYGQIPNAKTGKCKLTCTTYSGSTTIGSPTTAEFTVRTSQSLCAPSISGTVKDTNEATKYLTADENKLVKFFSNALCVASAEAKYGASIKKYIIAGIENKSGFVSVPNIETSSVTFVVEDSRGYRASQKVTLDLIQYTKLTANVSAKRKSPTSGEATLSIKGNYFDGSFGAEQNSLSAEYQIAKSGEQYGETVSLVPTIVNGGYSVSAPLTDLDYQNNYNVKVIVSDKLVTTEQTFVISKGIPIADWGERDFKFNVPVSGKAYGLSTLPYIPGGDDFNDYLTPGCYAVRDLETAKTVDNMPTQSAGRLFVSISDGSEESINGLWVYLEQRFVPNQYGSVYADKPAYVRYISREGNETWNYRPWINEALKAYPVGSIHLRYDHLNPGDLFGGTWERLTGAFLLGAGSDDTIGATGGGTLGAQLGVTGTDFGGITDKGSGSYSARIVVTEYGNENTDVGFRNLDNMGINTMPPYIQISVWRRTA